MNQGNQKSPFPGVPPGQNPRNIKWLFAGVALGIVLAVATCDDAPAPQENDEPDTTQIDSIDFNRMQAHPDGTRVVLSR